jgi:hypothetical protein
MAIFQKQQYYNKKTEKTNKKGDKKAPKLF